MNEINLCSWSWFKVQLSRGPMILYGLHGLHSLKLPNSQRHVFFLSLPNAYTTLHHGKLCFCWSVATDFWVSQTIPCHRPTAGTLAELAKNHSWVVLRKHVNQYLYYVSMGLVYSPTKFTEYTSTIHVQIATMTWFLWDIFQLGASFFCLTCTLRSNQSQYDSPF